MKQHRVRELLAIGLVMVNLAACSGSESAGVGTQGTTPSPPLNVPPRVPAIVVTSGTNFLSSPVRMSFATANFTIGGPNTPHMRFSVDNGPVNDFYVGTGNDAEVGVQLNGVHTHFAHWASPTSFDLFGLAAGTHTVRLALVDGSNTELSNNEAKTVHTFNIQQPPPGSLQLERVISGLGFPVSLAQAPDGRIFFNERLTGNIRVINTNWQLDPSVFCSVAVQTSGEQGLLGLALDPNFNLNQTIYVYYTASGSSNRVSTLVKQADGSCAETVILPTLPTSGIHNGGIITFGPDGKLYIVIGDTGDPAQAPDLTSLAGKILRILPDGSAPPDNPFFSNADPHAKKVFTKGHRNSFGLTFDPSGQLWESENGPDHNDEVNRIIAGKDYGWNINQQEGFLNQPCCMNPIVAFFNVIAPTGIVDIPSNSNVYPSPFRGNLLVAAFIDGSIRLVIPNGANPDSPGTTSVAYPGGVGGLLSLLLASDGYVYASSTNGEIFRVIPH